MPAEPRLKWKLTEDNFWRAECWAICLRVDANDRSWTVFGDFRVQGPSGCEDSLLAAQLAAESAALTWLREGVEALGACVLEPDNVPLVIEALGARHEYLVDGCGAEMAARGEAMLNLACDLTALARELEAKP